MSHPHTLIEKLRRLAADEAASEQEKATATEKADRLEAAYGSPPPPRPPAPPWAPPDDDLPVGWYYTRGTTSNGTVFTGTIRFTTSANT